MAELTPLDVKLGEALGLVQAAQEATRRVADMVEHPAVSRRLEAMCADAIETERRCLALVAARDDKQQYMHERGRAAREAADAVMHLCLDDGAEELDGLEYLTMVEAAELGHWEIVREMSDRIGDERVRQLAEWAIDVGERHRIFVRESSLQLAEEAVAPFEPARPATS